MFAYAARYGGPPRPDTPWALFVAGCRLVGRFEAIEFLRQLDTATLAVGSLTDEGAQRLNAERFRTLRVALPEFARPVFALKQSADPEP